MLGILLHIFLLLFAIVLLWKGADCLVKSATIIAATLGVSDLIIGLTVVAIGTSAPEFVVSVGSALTGYGDISLANVVGSNVFNIGIILGTVSMLHAFPVSRKLLFRDCSVAIGAGVVLLFFVRNEEVGRIEGLIFLLGLIAYMFLLYVQRVSLEEIIVKGRKAKLGDGAMLVLGIGMVLLGGRELVESATYLARVVGISEWVIGVTIVAAGTSAPEFFTSLVASLKGCHGISVGNLIGSNIFNTLGVVGLSAFIHPLVVDSAAWNSTLAMLLLTGMVGIFMRIGWRLNRTKGALLVTLSLFWWLLDFVWH